MPIRTRIQPFFDPKTWTVTYVVSDIATRNAAVVDLVLDYNFKSGRTDAKAVHALLAYVKSEKLYDLERSFFRDGSQFDHLFNDGEVFKIGDVEATALLVPGHTPADMAYLVDCAVFVGDTLFMSDVGTAQADFPGGDAHTLYCSIRRLLTMPPETRVFVCNDYPPKGRQAIWKTTIAEQKESNIYVRDTGSANAHPAINSDECPRRVATSGRRKRGRLLAHLAERVATRK